MENKITVELTPEQYERYQALESENISIGNAIDFMFEAKEQINNPDFDLLDLELSQISNKKQELEDELAKVNKEFDILNKIKNNALDSDSRTKVLYDEYSNLDDVNAHKLQYVKGKVKWAKKYFEL